MPDTPSIEEALGVADPESPPTPAPAPHARPYEEGLSTFDDDPMADLEESDDMTAMLSSVDKPVDTSVEEERGYEVDDDLVPTGREEASEAAGAESEAEGEDESGDIVLTKEEYETLMGKVEQRLAAVAEPEVAAPEAPPEPQRTPPPEFGSLELPEFEMPDELAEQVGIMDSKSFNKQMTTEMHKQVRAAAGQMVQQMLHQVAPVVAAQVNGYTPIAVAAYQFEEQYPEYEDHPNLVREALREEMEANPGVNPRTIFKNVAKRISFAAKKARKMKDRVDTVPKQGATQRGTGGRQAPQQRLSREEQMLREIAMLDMPVDPSMDMF